MSNMPGSTPPGWFPDPLGRHEHRWYNGTTWTSDVADGGQRFVDPLGIAPVTYPDRPATNGMATAAMTLGIIALLLAWIPFIVVIGIVLALLAIVFGIQGIGRARTAGRGRGFAIAGIVTGGVALAGSVAGIALTVVVWNEAVDFVEPGRHDVDVIGCVSDGRDVDVRGELTNRTRDTRDYTVFATVEETTAFVQLDDVAGGDTVEWELSIRSDTVVDDCDPVLSVHGPLPFGLEIDPIND